MPFRTTLATLLLIASAVLAGCHHAPDDAQVRKAITAAAAGAETGSGSAAVAGLSDDFDGNSGDLNKPALANLVRVFALRGQKIHVLLGPVSVEPRGERMVATFTATLTAGAGVLPDNAGAYQVETGWRKDGGKWVCFTASWKRAL
ncbi:hypothetical protein [Luteibacter aegosomatissinici]|uniref:hypothetical protein n=1 Tax=Luteibacter aegosomatissinici TaxID=2911539 RepID=UPI001FF80460|nr:hypothetical protein [Luteibacter aegosomatissinici]UPG95858.1 hypothetical protein L2Y97_07050 [Luteibacter aegosomatissinici]